MNLWNVKDLKAPPIATYKATFSPGKNDCDINNCYSSLIPEILQLRKHFEAAFNYFSNQIILEQEAALLSRCIYRMKMKFRSDKGLKSMEKLNRTLLQFKYLEFCSILEDFISLLPESNSDLYLPSRNMLDYILVRLQGATYLMNRASDVAQIVADNMGSRVCIGHSWKVGMIVLALVSRIWFICRNITKYCCHFYTNIKSVRDILSDMGNSWLPENYSLPQCLETWLDISWVNEPRSLSFQQVETKIPLQDPLKVRKCGNFDQIKYDKDEVIEIHDNNGKSVSKDGLNRSNAFDLLIKNDDFGEVISNPFLNVKESSESVIRLSSDTEDEDAAKINAEKDIKPVAVEELTWSGMNSMSIKTKDMKDNEIQTINTDCNFTNKSKICKKLQSNKKKKMNLTREENMHDQNRLELPKSTRTILERTEQQITNEGDILKAASKSTRLVKRQKKKSLSPASLIDNIDSVKKLKHFMLNITNSDSSRGFRKIDKLQLEMLKKLIGKYTKKVQKNVITDSECLLQAKQVLKVTFA
ncbi:hypothetical protein AMK59_6561 [Oryctes borbonicus]|uniref:Nucleolus and neural progenitor protein-like N-terminal domain-containing protein n=1 Tax=Oryctes borbonicus TaxID=1629725 RepID=A0A0T6AY11_9SCAR|nr:hypothetical protein AMK59_6561 [Oryctes borbonicus]